jgi:hypothetical protein
MQLPLVYILMSESEFVMVDASYTYINSPDYTVTVYPLQQRLIICIMRIDSWHLMAETKGGILGNIES